MFFTGESYAGLLVPNLMDQMIKAKSPLVNNLQAVALGNACTGQPGKCRRSSHFPFFLPSSCVSIRVSPCSSLLLLSFSRLFRLFQLLSCTPFFVHFTTLVSPSSPHQSRPSSCSTVIDGCNLAARGISHRVQAKPLPIQATATLAVTSISSITWTSSLGTCIPS